MTEATEPAREPGDLLPLKLPHPSQWIPGGLLGSLAYGAGSWEEAPEGTLTIATELLAVIVPVVAAAVLEAEADVLDSIQVAPPVAGGQYLRMRADKYRNPSAVIAADDQEWPGA